MAQRQSQQSEADRAAEAKERADERMRNDEERIAQQRGQNQTQQPEDQSFEQTQPTDAP